MIESDHKPTEESMKQDRKKSPAVRPDRPEPMDEEFDSVEIDDFDDEDPELFDESGPRPNFLFSKFEDSHVVIAMDDEDEVIDVIVDSGGDETEPGESEKMAGMIDHTILKADATLDQIVNLCREARENGFASVCVNSCWVRLCSELLRGSAVSVCSVVGFPLGAMISDAKAFETCSAIENGATEIDMVINIGALKSRDYRTVAKDILAVVDAAHSGGALVKVIIETCLLTEEEKKIACLISKACGAEFVKTSTGFSTGGATVEDVRNMKNWVGETVEVKASGGVRSAADAKAMIEAGASRIGTSSGIKISKGE